MTTIGVDKLNRGQQKRVLGGLLRPYAQNGHIHAVMQHHVKASALKQIRQGMVQVYQ